LKRALHPRRDRGESLHAHVVPQLLPASSGTTADVTPVTPGMAASSCSTRSMSAPGAWCRSRRDRAEMPKVATCSTWMPEVRALTLTRLFRNSPAEMSSAIDRAICAVTSGAAEAGGAPCRR
jgi:hypothetical protein